MIWIWSKEIININSTKLSSDSPHVLWHSYPHTTHHCTYTQKIKTQHTTTAAASLKPKLERSMEGFPEHWDTVEPMTTCRCVWALKARLAKESREVGTQRNCLHQPSCDTIPKQPMTEPVHTTIHPLTSKGRTKDKSLTWKPMSSHRAHQLMRRQYA